MCGAELDELMSDLMAPDDDASLAASVRLDPLLVALVGGFVVDLRPSFRFSVSSLFATLDVDLALSFLLARLEINESTKLFSKLRFV